MFEPKTAGNTEFSSNWNKAKASLEELSKRFREFRYTSEGNENYGYWNIFIDDIMFSVLTNFEVSVRRGQW